MSVTYILLRSALFSSVLLFYFVLFFRTALDHHIFFLHLLPTLLPLDRRSHILSYCFSGSVLLLSLLIFLFCLCLSSYLVSFSLSLVLTLVRCGASLVSCGTTRPIALVLSSVVSFSPQRAWNLPLPCSRWCRLLSLHFFWLSNSFISSPPLLSSVVPPSSCLFRRCSSFSFFSHNNNTFCLGISVPRYFIPAPFSIIPYVYLSLLLPTLDPVLSCLLLSSEHTP